MPTWDTATLFHRMRTITKTNKPLWDLHTKKYIMILCRGQFSIRINKPHNWLEQNGYLMAVKMAGTTKGLLGTLTMSIWSKLTTMDLNFVNTNQALSLFFVFFCMYILTFLRRHYPSTQLTQLVWIWVTTCQWVPSSLTLLIIGSLRIAPVFGGGLRKGGQQT